MIRGDGYAYFLSPPLGWVLDRSLAEASESDAILYPKGSTFKNAASVIYASVYPKDGNYKNLGDFLDQDLADAHRQNPGLKMEKGGFLSTLFQKTAALRFYSGLEDGSVEAVAYIEEKEMVVILSLSSSNPQILNEDLPALQELVGSYQLMELAQ